MPSNHQSLSLHGSGVVRLAGPNFSGRTDILRKAAGFDYATKGRSFYIGPDVHVHLSSFMPTVTEEFEFFAKGSPFKSVGRTLMAELGLDACGGHNPFHRALSGGQEAMLVILCRLVRGPEKLACDGCFEPLSQRNKRALIAAATSGDFGPLQVLVSDNRNEELSANETVHLTESEPNTPRLTSSEWKPTPPTARDLVLENVTFGYSQNRPILHNVSACFQAGTIHALIGENGSGKSTLAKLLCSILSPHGGTVRLGSQPIKRGKLHCAYHFQDADLQLFETTVLREINIGATTFPSDLVRAFGLESFLEHHPFDLPRVLRKRLALAATFAQGTPWLIIDEPTLGQDEHTCFNLAEMLISFANAGGGVIVISHSEHFLRLLNATRSEIISGTVHQ